MHLILLGAPGSGKGTLAKMLIEKYHLPHISTGDILRSAVKQGTELGKKAKSFMDKGELVPDDLILGIARERLAQEDCKKGFILDGFPRTIQQAESLEQILKELGLSLKMVINIDIPFSVIMERILSRRTCSNPACQTVFNIRFQPPRKEGICDKCGSSVIQREDETEEVVRNRLDVYEKQTAPLVDFYQKKKVLGSFQADSSKQIFEMLTEKLK